MVVQQFHKDFLLFTRKVVFLDQVSQLVRHELAPAFVLFAKSGVVLEKCEEFLLFGLSHLRQWDFVGEMGKYFEDRLRIYL